MFQSLCAAVLALAVLMETVAVVHWSHPMEVRAGQPDISSQVAQANPPFRY